MPVLMCGREKKLFLLLQQVDYRYWLAIWFSCISIFAYRCIMVWLNFFFLLLLLYSCCSIVVPCLLLFFLFLSASATFVRSTTSLPFTFSLYFALTPALPQLFVACLFTRKERKEKSFLCDIKWLLHHPEGQKRAHVAEQNLSFQMRPTRKVNKRIWERDKFISLNLLLFPGRPRKRRRKRANSLDCEPNVTRTPFRMACLVCSLNLTTRCSH